MNGVRIKYGNFAPLAKENFMPSTSESEFDTLLQLQKYNLSFPNYSNPCELYQTVLDGAAIPVPNEPYKHNLGMWSKQISDEAGEFEKSITLELTARGQYSAQGLYLTFDTQNDVYATELSIKWYRGEDSIAEKTFYPDASRYLCQNNVENFDRILIEFKKINMPQNRLKLRSIDYGYGVWFEGQNLRGVNLIQEINPISTEISINTADFVLDIIDSENKMLFQKGQPLSVYFNDELKSTCFIKNYKRKSKRLWSIQSEDYIGLLDSIQYYGGIYTNKNAVELLTDIFTVAKVPYSIDGVFDDVLVTGYIPFTSCRNALMQVAFAIGAVVDTANSEDVKVFSLPQETSQAIPLKRILQGQSFDEEETVTQVKMTAHTYKPVSQVVDVYDAQESGSGENIFVKFNQPLHDLAITSESEIVESGANYAIINAADNCLLTGQIYEHTTAIKTKNNPLALANDVERTAYIEGATLVSANNIDFLLERCYNYIVETQTTSAKIIESKHIVKEPLKYGERKYGEMKYGENDVTKYDKTTSVGEKIDIETEYLGTITGRIIKQKFNLNGPIVVKDCLIR